MKRLVFGLSLVLLLMFSTLRTLHDEIITVVSGSQSANVAQISTETISPASDWSYKVKKVVDGDTLDVSKDGKIVRLRLIGIDTPETVDTRKPVQCFGKAASDKAKELLTGKTVRLESDASQGTLDKYGRTLAYAFLPDPSTPLGASGISFNEYMIAEGYAHEYTYNLPYKYQKEFKAAEKRAREEKRGLWADDTCAGDTKSPPAS